MIPASATAKFTQGDDYVLPFKIRTAVWDVPTQAWVPGPAVDLTGWTGKCQFKKDYGVEPPVESTVTINPDQVAHKGEGVIRLTQAQTAQIADKWVFDLELIDATGFKETYISGKTKVKLQVTT